MLAWETPQAFDRVHLTFDNLASARHDYPWERGTRVLPTLVKAYELAARVDGAWQVLAHEDCNHNRVRCHAFLAVRADRLRLRVLATHGEPAQARVYQVRVLPR